jgi:hypothetical protein
VSAEGVLPYPDADLRAHPPRGPRQQLAGLVFLPRTIDKIRAKLQGTLGFYKIAPGMSVYLFEWLGITEEQFTEAVRAARSEADVAEWLTSHCDTTTFATINERMSERAIRDEAHFADVLPRYPVLRERPELRNWFEIFELDDVWCSTQPTPKRSRRWRGSQRSGRKER